MYIGDLDERFNGCLFITPCLMIEDYLLLYFRRSYVGGISNFTFPYFIKLQAGTMTATFTI